MRIKRDVLGWRIEPDTDNEERALEFLINALQEKYATPKETTNVSSTQETYTISFTVMDFDDIIVLEM
jgi:hypothetical protein